MKRRRLLVSVIAVMLLLSMAVMLVACGPTKNPEKVTKFIKKGCEKANFTMVIYDGEEDNKPFMSMKFSGSTAEISIENIKTVVEEKDDKMITYLIDEKGKVEKSEEPIANGDTIADMMNDALEEMKTTEFVYSERLGGFVTKEEENNELNTTYAVLDKGMLTVYDGEIVAAVLKDIGKTKVEIPKVD